LNKDSLEDMYSNINDQQENNIKLVELYEDRLKGLTTIQRDICANVSNLENEFQTYNGFLKTCSKVIKFLHPISDDAGDDVEIDLTKQFHNLVKN